MAIANEGNTDLAYDTGAFRKYSKRYGEIASELRKMSADLNKCLAELVADGWTSPAGTAFQKMVETDWEENIEKYADLLDTLQSIMEEASDQYEELTEDYIESIHI